MIAKDGVTVTSSFSEVCDAVDDGTVVFLDVDNTLITSDGPGSEHWEKAMTRELIDNGDVVPGQAWQVSCWLWSAAVRAGVPSEPCEKDTVGKRREKPNREFVTTRSCCL